MSLNIIRDGTLQIRTILEKGCAEVFLNSAATDLGRLAVAEDDTAGLHHSAAQRGVLVLPQLDPNEVAEKFSIGQISEDLGLPVNGERVVCPLPDQ